MDRLEDAPQIRVIIRYFTSEEVPYEQALQVSHLPLPKTGNPQPLSQSEDYWNPRGTNKNNYLPDSFIWSKAVKQLKSRECGTFYDF